MALAARPAGRHAEGALVASLIPQHDPPPRAQRPAPPVSELPTHGGRPGLQPPPGLGVSRTRRRREQRKRQTARLLSSIGNPMDFVYKVARTMCEETKGEEVLTVEAVLGECERFSSEALQDWMDEGELVVENGVVTAFVGLIANRGGTEEKPGFQTGGLQGNQVSCRDDAALLNARDVDWDRILKPLEPLQGVLLRPLSKIVSKTCQLNAEEVADAFSEIDLVSFIAALLSGRDVDWDQLLKSIKPLLGLLVAPLSKTVSKTCQLHEEEAAMVADAFSEMGLVGLIAARVNGRDADWDQILKPLKPLLDVLTGPPEQDCPQDVPAQ